MTQKAKTLLGFAAKAGKLSYGMDAAVSSVKSKKSKLLICCSDLSPKSKKEIIYYSDKFDLPFMVLDETMQDMLKTVGKKCGILSVNDAGFRDSIIQEEKQ